MARVDDAAVLSVLSSRLSGMAVAVGHHEESAALTDLLDHLQQIPDWRHRRWVAHPLAAVLALCAGAVVAGMRGFTAIAGWVRDVPSNVVEAVYARCGQAKARAPSKCTLWRVVTGTPGDVLAASLFRRSTNDLATD